jgi:hypothetical protein
MYFVGGIGIRFHFRDIDNANALKEILGYHKLPHSDNDFYHDIYVQSTCHEPVMDSADQVVWEGRLSDGMEVNWCIQKDTQEHKVYIGKQACAEIVQNSKTGSTNCFVYEYQVGDKKIRPELYGYFFSLLHSTMSIYKRYVMHSACVSLNKKAVLLIGESGVGKSTLSIMLAKAGFDFMGDDLVILENSTAHAFLASCKLVNTQSGEKEVYDLVKNDKVSVCYSANISAVIKLVRTGKEESYLEPIEPIQAFALLMRQLNPLQTLYNADNCVAMCDSLSRIKAYNLFFGNKDNFEPDMIKNIL